MSGAAGRALEPGVVAPVGNIDTSEGDFPGAVRCARIQKQRYLVVAVIWFAEPVIQAANFPPFDDHRNTLIRDAAGRRFATWSIEGQSKAIETRVPQIDLGQAPNGFVDNDMQGSAFTRPKQPSRMDLSV